MLLAVMVANMCVLQCAGRFSFDSFRQHLCGRLAAAAAAAVT